MTQICKAFPILAITDGTTRIDLHNCGGYHVSDWEPFIPGPKGGGTWQSSPLAEGRQLVDWQWQNWIDVFTFTLQQPSQNTNIQEIQELLRLLVKAHQYWTTDWQDEPVWLEARAARETNLRYALIKSWRVPGVNNPFTQPFILSNQEKSVVPDFELTVEHNAWIGDEPGTGTCVQTSGTQYDYPFNLEFDGLISEVEVSDNAAIQDLPTADMTAEAWIRADGWGEGNAGRIFDKATWSFRVLEHFGIAVIAIHAVQSAQSISSDWAGLADGEWHHVAATFDVPNLTIRLFVDGVEVTYDTQDAAIGAYTTDVGSDLYIGNRAANDATFDGGIGWCRLSDNIRYPATPFTPPPRCQLPAIDGNTIAQWIGVEISGATIDNQETTAALDGTQSDCVFARACEWGRTATCDNEVYVANKQNHAQLTHIYVDDGGAFGANLAGGGAPFNILPAVPAVGDIFYAGIDTTVADSGPFCSLVFNVVPAQADVTGIIWEYWNGAWVALTVQDNTNADGAMTGVAFDTLGVNSVHWEHPSDWATVAVNGVTGYWVRARVTAIGGAPTGPKQALRDVYTILWPYVEIAAAQVGGDIKALAQILINNQSGAVIGNNEAADIVMGLRSTSRGTDFGAYINMADEQNTLGITVTAPGVAVAFQNDIAAPSGRSILFNPAGVFVLATQVIISMSQAIARQFYGTYHIYMRTAQTGGAVGDFSIALDILGLFVTEEVSVDDVSPFAVTDLGQVEIAPVGTLSSNDVLNDGTISIQLANSNAAPGDLTLYDLILIPVDEWGIRASWTTNDTMALDDILDVDSIIHPKVHIRSLLRDSSDDSILSIWQPITPSSAILQANSEQRIWIFTIDSASESYPYTAHSVQAFANRRYLYARGNR